MTTEEFSDFECERLSSYTRIINQSLQGNPDEIERQVIMEVVTRAIEGEKEFVRDDPATYKDLYFVR